MTWRYTVKIFAPCDHDPLFLCLVGGVVTAPVGFSMLFARRGIVPHLLGAEMNSGPSRLAVG